MRKLIAAAVAAAAFAFAFVAAPAPRAEAQAIPQVQIAPLRLQPVSSAVVAADVSPMLVIKYFKGANTTASTSATTVAAATNNTYTFVVNGAAYAGFECPVSGALGGIIDATNAACNTLGEVVDVINSTSPNFATGYFRAAIVAGLRTDSSAAVLDQTATSNVSRPEGVTLFWDSSVLDDDEVMFWDSSKGFRFFGTEKGLPSNPRANEYSFVYAADLDITNGGTVGDFNCYAVKENYGFATGDSVGAGSETVRTIIGPLPAATTATSGTITVLPYGFYAKEEKVFCRVDSSGADTSVWAGYISGYTFPIQ